jgi:hypothetical protein
MNKEDLQGLECTRARRSLPFFSYRELVNLVGRKKELEVLVIS